MPRRRFTMDVIGALMIVLAGATLGVIGGGGSILTVPILVYLFNEPAEQATSYSLFLVGLAALVGAKKYASQKNIAYSAALNFALPSFLGVFLVRHYLLPSIPNQIKLMEVTLLKDNLILFVFALVMVLAAFSMIKTKSTNAKRSGQSTVHSVFMILYGALVGSVTGFVGAGEAF